MKKMYASIISFIFLVGSIVFFSLYYEIILINPPKIKSHENNLKRYEKKTVTLHFWQDDTWHKEDTDILWSDDPALSAQYLINSWLNLLDEESITQKKISLQSALASQTGSELYISFDRSPLEKEAEIFQKIMIIESLLTTLKTNDLDFSSINFLVHHQPIHDNHLDFSQSWPGQGFMN